MSRSRTRRTVLSATQRAAIERDLRRGRLAELPTLLERAGLDGDTPGADLVARACCLSDLRASLEADQDPLVALALLRAECRALARQAEPAGIDRSEVQPLVSRIDDLVGLADGVPLGALLAATDALYSDAAALEAAVVDRMNEVQTLRLAGAAATLVLGRMGLDLTEEALLGRAVRIRATGRSGMRAQVSIEGRPACIELVTGDQPAMARALRHEDDGCHGAVELAVEFHTMIERELRDAGLGLGRVETVPRRSAANRFWSAPRRPSVGARAGLGASGDGY